MKAFKKLMAAALVCVMALTMLTGCAVSDNLVEKALVNKLNAVSAVSYKHKTDLDDEAILFFGWIMYVHYTNDDLEHWVPPTLIVGMLIIMLFGVSLCSSYRKVLK